MEQATFQTAEWNDLVFENRNKDYGAYVLRMEHERNTAFGVYSIFGIMAGITLIAILYSKLVPATFVDPMRTSITPIDLSKTFDIIIEKPKTIETQAQIAKPVKSEQFSRIEIVQQTDKGIAPQDDLNKTTASATTVTDGTSDTAPALTTGTSTTTTTEIPTTESPIISALLSVQPMFPGGDEALNNYLSKNIHYTNNAREAGIQGNIFVTFVIGKDGKPENVVIARGLSYGLNEIAEAVIKNMPAWSPGKMGDKAVRVSYSLRLSFKLN